MIHAFPLSDTYKYDVFNHSTPHYTAYPVVECFQEGVAIQRTSCLKLTV